MEITYGKCKHCGEIIFSFNRHDYKTCTCGKAMIDGGLDYIRTNNNTEILKGTLHTMIISIRNSFTWGKNYDKDNNRLEKTEFNLLKDLTTPHILGILKYFTEGLKEEQKLTNGWKMTHLIFIEELLYRYENNT